MKKDTSYQMRCVHYYERISQRLGDPTVSLLDVCVELSEEFPYYSWGTIRLYYYMGARYAKQGVKAL